MDLTRNYVQLIEQTDIFLVKGALAYGEEREHSRYGWSISSRSIGKSYRTCLEPAEGSNTARGDSANDNSKKNENGNRMCISYLELMSVE